MSSKFCRENVDWRRAQRVFVVLSDLREILLVRLSFGSQPLVLTSTDAFSEVALVLVV